MDAFSLAVGALAGAFLRLAFETARYVSWRSLEDEVAAWQASPRGRVHAFLDGLGPNPSDEGYRQEGV